MDREYKLNIDPSILELLGPSLYTNIYYVLAELIANAYDADAHNVYIIIRQDAVIVEDDGNGMSYGKGEVGKYLKVAAITRTNECDSVTYLNRKKMGRKGIGKLAALSVSENVYIKTVSDDEKSGFILSRYIGEDKLLEPIPEDNITFNMITKNGTAVAMQNPQYKLSNNLDVIRHNLLKIFPLVNSDFQIHLIKGDEIVIINKFEEEIIKDLSTLITLGEEFSHLGNFFDIKYPNRKDELLKINPAHSISIDMINNYGKTKKYDIVIKGWIGTYSSTIGRKKTIIDFPDNFISLYANGKMGEFNILPAISQNRVSESFIVGQLHIDIFELTELPDMALSNRQGYKTDDKRYVEVLKYVREKLLQEILNMRQTYVDLSNKNVKKEKRINNEKKLKESIDSFKKTTSEEIAKEITKKIKNSERSAIKYIVENGINHNLPKIGIKKIAESSENKKKILISHTKADKDLADIVYDILIYNNVPSEDILYTSCDEAISRIPEGENIYDYLRECFVNSCSTQKIFVIFITSKAMSDSWGAMLEVGAAWITRSDHKIFNIGEFTPKQPLDTNCEYHCSNRDEASGRVCMTNRDLDVFCEKIIDICERLGYNSKTKSKSKEKFRDVIMVKNDE